MIDRLSRLRRWALALLVLCCLGVEARAQHVVTPEEANKLTFDSLVGGGGGGGGGAPRQSSHRYRAAPRYARYGRHASVRGRWRGNHDRYASARGWHGRYAGTRGVRAPESKWRNRAVAPIARSAARYRQAAHASMARGAHRGLVHEQYKRR